MSRVPEAYRIVYAPPPIDNANPFLNSYNSMHAKPMEVIHHLYYRVCGEFMPEHYKKDEMRNWTGGPKARVPSQDMRLKYEKGVWNPVSTDPTPDPPLEIKHILEVMTWLFTGLRPERQHQEHQARYLNRLQCVNAQAIAAGYKNTKHRPYDMLAAIFLCADFMSATQIEKVELKGFQHTFMQMYLEQSTHFDYKAKDIFWHNHIAYMRVPD